MNYTRQSDLIIQSRVSLYPISIIGCGALGSATAMCLAKMGVNKFELWDEDGINEVNLPNQMYRIKDLNKFKVEALAEIIREYNNEAEIYWYNKHYNGQNLCPIVIVTTDSMLSRKMVWDRFQNQSQPQILIEARMGAEEGQIYTIRKKPLINNNNEEDKTLTEVALPDIEFYQERLYADTSAVPAPCTAKAIIYNVFMVASLVGRAFKAVTHDEPFPREVVFGMKQIHKYSFQVRE